MSLRFDPTRTTTLRRVFEANIRRRFVAIGKAVRVLIEDEDALGVAPFAMLTFLAERQTWRFLTDEAKVVAFGKWLQKQVDLNVLSKDFLGQPWVKKYIKAAYEKGARRAFVDGKRGKLVRSPEFAAGMQEQFTRSVLQSPSSLNKVALLATRAFEELEGFSKAMATQLTRILVDGLIRGDGPGGIAKEMVDTIDGLSKVRAVQIARTEIIRAHAEGQLDTFESFGTDVGVLAEWLTAGDERVCSQCSAMEGKILTVEEARGLIPLHPSCRCAWIPAVEVQDRERRKTRRKK